MNNISSKYLAKRRAKRARQRFLNDPAVAIGALLLLWSVFSMATVAAIAYI